MKSTNLGAAEGLPVVDWKRITDTIEAGAAPAPDDHNARTTWLTTINADGTPHVTPVGAIWFDGTYWFQTGSPTKKHRNLDRDPRCTIATSIRDADVIVDGVAERITDPDVISRAAAAWAEGGWPAEPHESGTGITAPFNAPAQGPPPWHVYRLTPRSAVVCLGAEPGGLTRFEL